MDFDKIKFNGKDIIQILGVAGMLMTMYYNLVSEIRQNKVFDEADKKVINFRLSQLEKNQLSYDGSGQKFAVLPKEIKIEHE